MTDKPTPEVLELFPKPVDPPPPEQTTGTFQLAVMVTTLVEVPNATLVKTLKGDYAPDAPTLERLLAVERSFDKLVGKNVAIQDVATGGDTIYVNCDVRAVRLVGQNFQAHLPPAPATPTEG